MTEVFEVWPLTYSTVKPGSIAFPFFLRVSAFPLLVTRVEGTVVPNSLAHSPLPGSSLHFLLLPLVTAPPDSLSPKLPMSHWQVGDPRPPHVPSGLSLRTHVKATPVFFIWPPSDIFNLINFILLKIFPIKILCLEIKGILKMCNNKFLRIYQNTCEQKEQMKIFDICLSLCESLFISINDLLRPSLLPLLLKKVSGVNHNFKKEQKRREI